MAKQKVDNTEEVKKIKQYKATAKQYIKYGGKYLAVGDEFDVEEKDVKELSQYADIEKIEVEATPKDDNEKGEGQKEGE